MLDSSLFIVISLCLFWSFVIMFLCGVFLRVSGMRKINKLLSNILQDEKNESESFSLVCSALNICPSVFVLIRKGIIDYKRVSIICGLVVIREMKASGRSLKEISRRDAMKEFVVKNY